MSARTLGFSGCRRRRGVGRWSRTSPTCCRAYSSSDHRFTAPAPKARSGGTYRRAWPRPGRRRLSTDEAADPVPHPVVAPEHASTARHPGIRVPAMVTARGSSADGARADMSRTGAGGDHAVRPQGDRCRRLPRVDGRQSPAHHAALGRPPVLARRQLHVGHAGRRCRATCCPGSATGRPATSG